jgi:hypothetical protein
MEGKMTNSTQDLFDKAVALSGDVDDNFLELGKALRQLQDRDPDLFHKIVAKSNLGRRKAYYVVEVSRIFDPLPVPRARLRNIGWTKLQLIAKHVKPDNMEDLLKLAEEVNAKELERRIKGEKPLGNAHCVLMYFSPKQYAELEAALLKNGATRSGRGIVDKEEALINALRKAAPGLENVQPAMNEPADEAQPPKDEE